MEDKILSKKKPIIVTHDGKFHADDSFAVATLLLYLGKDIEKIELVRSRKDEDWKRADFVVDVGGVYNETENRFDHHQSGGAGKRINEIPYAAFGLVWKKFGEALSGSMEIAEAVDATLVQSADAHDSGVRIFEPTTKEIFPFLWEEFIFMQNPTWREDLESEYDKFVESVIFSKKILERVIVFCKDEEIAKEKVIEAYRSAGDKRIIVLEKNYPWKKVIGKFPEPLFVVSPRSDGFYHAKAVSDFQFKNRKDMPESWAGKRDAELAEVTGVSDAVFCHNGRFMAVAKSKEGAIALAKLAL